MLRVEDYEKDLRFLWWDTRTKSFDPISQDARLSYREDCV